MKKLITTDNIFKIKNFNNTFHRALGLRINKEILKETLKLIFDFKKYILFGKIEIVKMFGSTTLGALWQPITTSVIVFGVGYIFGALFNFSAKEYVPYFCISLILWNTISASANEFSGMFTSVGEYQELPFSKLILVPMITISKISYMLLLNLTVLVFSCVLYQIFPGFIYFVFTIIGLIMCVLITFFSCIILSLIGSRYSDFPNITQNALQILFYVTPVMWKAESIPHKWVYQYNPMYHILDLVRRPLIYGEINFSNYLFGILALIIIFIASILLWSIFAWRINYHQK